MKLILSRKGFDSTNGGCPSPILDGRLCSLPIPDAGASTRYGEISSFNGSSIARIVEDLTRGRISDDNGAHLDPDLRRDSIARDRRMASDLRAGRGCAEPSRAPGDSAGRSVFIFRMLPTRGENRRRVSLHSRRAKTSRYLRMATGRESCSSHRRPHCRNPVGRWTSASRRARAIQKQHALFCEPPSFVDWRYCKGRGDLRSDQA